MTVLVCAAVAACSGSHAIVPDPPPVVRIEIHHDTPRVERGVAHGGHSAILVDAHEWAPAGDIAVDGPCLLAERPPGGPPESKFVDVGAVNVVTPARTMSFVADEWHYPWIDFVESPNEWGDDDRLVISGAGNARFPAFDAEIRAASRVTFSPALTMFKEFTTTVARGRDFVVSWSPPHEDQDALVALYVSDQVEADVTHVRRADCRGRGAQLVIPSTVMTWITEPPWTPTFIVWTAVAERRVRVTTVRGEVDVVSHTPFISSSLDNWTTIVLE